jgi:peroxiredoxin
MNFRNVLAGLAVILTTSSSWAVVPALGEDAGAVKQDSVVGQPAPDFTLVDSLGKKHELSQYKDKYVVLEWVNFKCPFVAKHYDSGNMQSLQKHYTAKGVTWLTICSSAPGKAGNYSPEEINKILHEKGAAPTAYLIDADGSVGKKYGAKTTPTMCVIDRAGSLVYEGAIDDKVSTDTADIKGATNYVKAALDEAMNGKPVKIASTKSYGCSVKY